MQRPMMKCMMIILLLLPTMAVAQEVDVPQPIEQLKAQVSRLEVFERDGLLPDDVKDLNRRSLAERRGRLAELLRGKVAALNTYRSSVEGALTREELRALDQQMQDESCELKALEKELSPPSFDTHRAVTKWLAAASELPLVPSDPAVPPQAEKCTSSLQQDHNLWRLASAATTTPIVPAAQDPLASTHTQSQRGKIQQTPTPLDSSIVNAVLNKPTAELSGPREAEQVIAEAINKNLWGDLDRPGLKPDLKAKDFYCVIHVLRWSDPGVTTPAALGGQQTVVAQNWYVYNNGGGKGFGHHNVWTYEDFAVANRLFGVKKIWLLYIHLNKSPAAQYTVRYDYLAEKKTPAPLSNLLNVAQLFVTFTNAAPDEKAKEVKDVWGASAFAVDYVPSDITITANVIENAKPDTGPVTALDKPHKFDNEGRYWWDFSVAVPIRRISETQFDITAGTITAKKVDKQNAFALLNLYPIPVDVKGTNYSWTPHFIGGVAIAKQPLKKFLLGVGFGPHFANFYIGGVWAEQQAPSQLKEGAPATATQLNSDLRRRYKGQVSFGINLPVQGVVEALKKANK